jgi:hypothetical protein
MARFKYTTGYMKDCCELQKDMQLKEKRFAREHIIEIEKFENSECMRPPP